ncbi:class I glutamine amidotransferase-like protein [Earliella scabrosa]|nr:class I glutamine amidotransferase-like protein [Earliella scabrosa]
MSEQATARTTPSGDLPTKAGLLVFPAFEPLDAFGPIEALHALAFRFRKLDLYVIGPSLDPVSTHASNPSWNMFGSNFGITVQPTHTFADPPSDLEVLVVPGGGGALEAADSAPMIEFVKRVYPKLKYLITVCNGASIPARAGVLDGKRATTNKSGWKLLTEMGPNVQWVKTARWVVDGNCWTSSGVSAGIDATLAWIASVYGEEMARQVAIWMEYERNADPSHDPFAEIWGDGMESPHAT